MRPLLAVTFLMSFVLVACTSVKDTPPGKHLSQSGALKVHPGLVGQPVPAELQQVKE
jgi:peptidoglycan-associated lipoprotein